MDSSLRAELDARRLRAYGRSADDTLDPDLMRRLQELETHAREARYSHLEEPATATEPHASSDRVPAAPSPPLAQTPTGGSSQDARAGSRNRRPRSWRRPSRLMLAIWAATVGASAALAATSTFAMVGILPVAVSSDAPQIVTLEPDPAAIVPVGFFGAGASSATYEFYGLTMFETSSNVYGNSSGGGDCFTAVLSSDIPEETNAQGGFSTSGPFYSGCRVGNFPATITIPVDSSVPPEMRAQFPNGALQFIKDGDRIGVFLGERG